MIKQTAIMLALFIVINPRANAQDSPELEKPVRNTPSLETAASTSKNAALQKLDPYRAVHEGNQRLLNGDAATALDYYDHARKLKPDAREVDFVQGLGHYALEEYEDARQAFQRAAGGLNDSLANDALYSLGTAYHAEALSSKEDPQLALSHLESAMRQYHNVLANDPEHQAAQDANLKAATLWRNIKQVLEQQQQQQSDENQDQENEENEKKEDQEKKDQQPSDENKDPQGQDKQQENQENQDQNESDKQDQQQQSSENDKKEQEEKQQQAQAKQQEEVSHEQAERKLREMMQALRERKKAKRQTQRVPIQPVDKDW